MLNKGGNLIAGKQFTDLTKASALKDTNIIAVHDGNGLKKASMEDVTMYMADKFSNPNLLINPNFKINQRGQATYETSGASQIYSVDRWRLGKGKVTVNSDGTVTVTATGGTTNEEGYYQQQLENAISGDYTVSMEVISVSGAVRIAIDGAWQNVKSGLNVFHGITRTGAVGLQLANGASITLKWVKLEQGSIATPFVAPNSGEELEKCRAFYLTLSKSLVGYRLANGVLIRADDVAKMKKAKTAIIIGENKSAQLVCEGTSVTVVISSIDVMDGNIVGLYMQNLQSTLNLRTIGVDFNDSQIAIDAEIY